MTMAEEMTLCQKVEIAIKQAATDTDKAWAALCVMQAHNRTAPPIHQYQGLRDAGRFLLDRIDDLSWTDGGYDDLVRDWMGHVDPALDRFRQALSTLPQQAATDEGEKDRARKLLADLDALLGKPIRTGPVAEDAFKLILSALSSPTSQPLAAETRLIEAERQFARIKDVEQALANGAHYADDPECHPCYPTLVAARQILEKLFAALTQPEPPSQQGGGEKWKEYHPLFSDFAVEHDDGEFTIYTPSGYSVSVFRDGEKLVVCNPSKEGFKAFSANLATLSAQQATVCSGCEGKPAPENNPCAVCGKQAAGEAEARERLKLAELVRTRLLGVHHDEQDLYLENHDWQRIIAALSSPQAAGEAEAVAWRYEREDGMIEYLTEQFPWMVEHGWTETPLYATPQPTETQRIVAWRTDDPPKDGTVIYRRVISVYRFQPYKLNSQQAKRGQKGRWQEMNEYGGWDNCNQPLGNEWTADDPFAASGEHLAGEGQ
jgi:hypothetical protein